MKWIDNEKFAECRTMTGHRWYKSGKPTIEKSDLYRQDTCRECGTVRHKWFNLWDGRTTKCWYQYPVGYLIEVLKGKRKSTLTELRAQYFRRAVKRGHVARGKKAA